MPDSTVIHPAEAALERIQAVAVTDGVITDDKVTPVEETPTTEPVEPEAEAQADGATDESESETEEKAAEDESLKEYEAELAKHGAPSLEDLPPEARPLVEKRLKDMQAAFTRSQQEATSFRKDKAEYEAKTAYEKQYPVDAIVERLLSEPTLLDKVNEELTKLQEPVYAEAKTMRRETERTKATIDAENARRATEQREQRAIHVETQAESLAAKAGIPLSLVEANIAYTIQTKGDITDAELKGIIESQAAIYKRHVGGHKAAKAKEYAKDKVKDQKTAGLKVKPGSPSTVSTVTKPKLPETRVERWDAILASMGVPE